MHITPWENKYFHYISITVVGISFGTKNVMGKTSGTKVFNQLGYIVEYFFIVTRRFIQQKAISFGRVFLRYSENIFRKTMEFLVGNDTKFWIKACNNTVYIIVITLPRLRYINIVRCTINEDVNGSQMPMHRENCNQCESVCRLNCVTVGWQRTLIPVLIIVEDFHLVGELVRCDISLTDCYWSEM